MQLLYKMMAISFLTLICAAIISAHPDGAPLDSCDTMTPIHPPNQQQNSPPPYTITISSSTVAIGGNVTVTISSPSGNEFQGFLIKALPSGVNSGVAGTFTNDFPHAHYLDCDNVARSAVTHSDPSNKTSITLSWSTESPGIYNFKATVAQSYTPFWVGFYSELITVQ